MEKKKKKTLSEKAVEWLKGGARKRPIGKVIGITRNDKTKKAMEEAFGSNF